MLNAERILKERRVKLNRKRSTHTLAHSEQEMGRDRSSELNEPTHKRNRAVGDQSSVDHVFPSSDLNPESLPFRRD